ncbi:MAG: hypothetical protein RLZZ387_753, partial [Chloroflexota bacterium]
MLAGIPANVLIYATSSGSAQPRRDERSWCSGDAVTSGAGSINTAMLIQSSFDANPEVRSQEN